MTATVTFQRPRLPDVFWQGWFSQDDTEERIIQKAQRVKQVVGS
jgi:hypothetical protein